MGRETVKHHVSEILSKLGVGSREEAARWEPERRQWWSLAGPLTVAKAAGAAVVAAAIVGLGVLAWGVLSAGGGSDVDPLAGVEGEIAYEHEQEIWIANADGSGARKLDLPQCGGELWCYVLNWSPDGNKLAFISAVPGLGVVGNVYAFDLKAEVVTEIADYRFDDVGDACEGGSTYWGWSPDGSSYAYSVDSFPRADFVGRVRLANINDTNAADDTVVHEAITAPSWSSDGVRFAYAGPARSGDEYIVIRCQDPQIYVGDSSEPGEWLTAGSSPAWSPVDNEIVFLGSDVEGSPRGWRELRLISSDGTGERVIGGSDLFRGPLSWSPDGSQVLARSLRGILVIDKVSGQAVTIGDDTFGDSRGEAGWSPDGKFVAFTVGSRGMTYAESIYIIAADGTTDPVKLVDGSSAAWRVPPG